MSSSFFQPATEGQPRLHLRALGLVEMRRLLVEHLVEIPHHGVALNALPVVKFQPRAA